MARFVKRERAVLVVFKPLLGGLVAANGEVSHFRVCRFHVLYWVVLRCLLVSAGAGAKEVAHAALAAPHCYERTTKLPDSFIALTLKYANELADQVKVFPQLHLLQVLDCLGPAECQ